MLVLNVQVAILLPPIDRVTCSLPTVPRILTSTSWPLTELELYALLEVLELDELLELDDDGVLCSEMVISALPLLW